MQPNAKLLEFIFALTGRAFSHIFLCGIGELRHLKPSYYVHMKQPEVTPCFLQEHQQPIRFTRQLRLQDVPNP